MSNRLTREPSPYLQQHAHNPVDWYPWGKEALDKAKKENKLIFLSIGYSSCHWCHVMERESFEDDSVAAYLNQYFIPVKVDREERPDLDAVYMEAVQLMTGQGGWPLSVWLTPDQTPVFGGTYFPPDPMHGRPSFMQVLQRLVHVYKYERSSVTKHVEKIRESLTGDLLGRISETPVQDELLENAASVYGQQFDETHGGFSPSPKFPMAMGISFLLKYASLYNKPSVAKIAAFSLESMINGGIYDQIGGGFHRYSVDTYWQVPHFEKMLYDNALLVDALTDAYLVENADLYRGKVEETIGFLTREMKDEKGGFYSALDADSEGEEGKFYIWEKEEIEQTLGPEAAEIFCTVYNILDEGNWEGVNIPHLDKPVEQHAANSGMEVNELENLLAECREKLLEVRDERIRPGLDDKVIVSWNAMLLKSLSRASRVFNRDDWKQTVVKLAVFLAEECITDGRVRRFWKDGKTRQDGFLDDVALLAEAFCHVFEVTGDKRWLQYAEQLCRTLEQEYYDALHQGFHYNTEKHEQLITRSRDLFDNATPSGNSAAIAALWRTGMHTGNREWVQIAGKCTEKLIETASRHATSFGYLLQQALVSHKHASEIIISGPEPSAFLSHFNKNPGFDNLLVAGNDVSDIPYPPYNGKKPIDGRTACYVCRDFACQVPVTDSRDLPRVK